MAITLKTQVNKIERSTTVTAIDSQYCAIYSTWSLGTGSRVATRLQEEAQQHAEQHLRRLLLASASTTTEARLLSQRV